MNEVGTTTAADVLVRRRGILDRTGSLVGYEVLATDGDEILRAIMEVGVDRLVGERRAFLHVASLEQGQALSETLDPSRCVLVVPPGGTSAPKVAADYDVLVDGDAAPEWASLVRIPHDAHGDETGAVVGELQSRGIQVIAGGVDDHEQYEQAYEQGFDFFCGHWFTQPVDLSAKEIPANKLNLLQLLALVCDPDACIDDLETLISQDVGLSYRLVRTVNSAAFGLQHQVDSIGQAVMMIGMQRLRSWVQMISLANVEGKASELMIIAMIRAGMCERLGNEAGLAGADKLFTVGLFSVLDAILDLPMELIVDELNLSDAVRSALVERDGDAGAVLRCVLAHERGAWEDVGIAQLEVADIMRAYLESVIWADETMALLNEAA